MQADDAARIIAPHGMLDIWGNTRLTTYVDETNGYIVLGVTRTDGGPEEMYFSVRNDKLYIDHRRIDGTWKGIVLG